MNETRINKWKNNKIIQKDICFECKSNENIQYHHVVPYTLGGKETIPLCNICHEKIHDRKFVNTSSLVKEALRKKKEQGIILGRPTGTGKTDEVILNNPKYQPVIKYLNMGYSMRKVAHLSNVALNTVLKVSKILKK
jgi:hypothetical protein